MLLVEEVPGRPHLVDRVDLEVVLVESEPLGPLAAMSKISAPSISSVSDETLSPQRGEYTPGGIGLCPS